MTGRLAAFVLALALLPGAAVTQQFGRAQFPIKADDGSSISNHSLRPEQAAEVAKLPGAVDVGAPGADVTLHQFYDLNCPYCREASADVDALIRSDPKLRVVLVPYAVLSIQSVEGARVELALRELGTPQQFLEFHRRIYAGRGVIDGNRALAAAEALGFDRKKVIDAANTRKVTEILTAHAKVGNDLKLVATPAYVLQGVAIVGHPGREALRKAIAAVRRCKAVVC